MNEDRTLNAAAWPDLSGHFSDGHHVLPVRVYFEDTDFSGVVYHTSYMRWCERGRSDYLRLAGISHTALSQGALSGEPSAFAVRRIKADFLKPARIDDVLEVRTQCGEVTKASITLSQTITRDGKPIFGLEAQCVLIGAGGKLLRLPQNLMQLLPRAAHC